VSLVTIVLVIARASACSRNTRRGIVTVGDKAHRFQRA
jgi:hypothetical protein